MKLRWPMPPDDASYPRRLAQLVLLPVVVGLGGGLLLAELLGSTLYMLIVLPIALVWSIKEARWLARQKRELLDAQAEFERTFRHVR